MTLCGNLVIKSTLTYAEIKHITKVVLLWFTLVFFINEKNKK